MAFYQFLAIFPTLLVVLAVPSVGDFLRRLLRDLSGQVLPSQGARLLAAMMDEFSRRAASGYHSMAVCAGALWAAGNASLAMVHGLNRAYEVEEGSHLVAIRSHDRRPDISPGVHEAEAHVYIGTAVFYGVEWLGLILALCFSFAFLYRFAPSVRDHEWRWSIPGAVYALVLWVAATFAARIYFDRVNDYSFVYGRLNGVIMLLLWLYVTSGATLIGGELNSEIEKAAQQPAI